MGSLYFADGDLDQAADAFRNAARSGFNPDQYGLALARAYQLAGRNDEAVAILRDAVTRKEDDPTTQLSLAEACLAKQLSLPKGQRDWSEFARAVDLAAKTQANAVSIALLRAEHAAAVGSLQDGIKILDAATKQTTDSPALWKALASVQARNQNLPEAERAAAEFKRLSGDDSLQPLLLQASILAQAGQFDQAKQLLVSAMSGAAPERQLEIKRQLAESCLRSGQRSEGRKLYAELADANEHDLKLAILAAQLAWEDRDRPDLDRWSQRLQTLEGSTGTHWHDFRVRALLGSSGRVSQQDLREATQLLKEIEELRPNWPQLYMLRGFVARLQGRTHDAIDAFNNAIQFGDKSVSTCEQLLELLQQEGRFPEAAQVLARVREIVSSSDRLTAAAIPVLLRTGEVAEALQLAEDRVRLNPKAAVGFMRLGTTLVIAAESDAPNSKKYQTRAEKSFKKAVALDPANVQAWLALLQFYARTVNDQQKALAALQEFSNKSDLPPGKKALVLAQIYESIGQYLRAGEEYATAASIQDPGSTSSDQAQVLERAARFYSSRSPSIAEQYCRRALQLAPESLAARTMLLTVLAERGGEAEMKEAFGLLKQLTDSGFDPTQARRFEIRLLMRCASKTTWYEPASCSREWWTTNKPLTRNGFASPPCMRRTIVFNPLMNNTPKP